MIRINRLIGSFIWNSLLSPLLCFFSVHFITSHFVLLSQLVRIKSIITSIFPVTHPPIFCDRTKIKPSLNHSPVVEIGVALNKLKNVIVSAVITSNYLAFHLASHTNWLFIVQ